MPRNPDTLIDRHQERNHLQELLAKGTPQLVLMYGRRRVGKTHLLGRVWPSATAFYFTASETTETQNRAALLAAFAEWSGEEIQANDYSNWRQIFRMLLDYRSPEPLAVIIDEFQYLGENTQALKTVASELNAAWEMRRPNRPIVFVISGSAVRTLESLNSGESPLYGRFSWQHQLRPFNYWYSGELAGFTALRDRAYAYGTFGGTPRYLAAIDPDRPLTSNIQNLMLSSTGEVRELVRTALLQEQGLRDIPQYVAILRAIGHGRTTLNEIAQDAGLTLDTGLRDKVARLVDLNYIKAYRNLGAARKEAFRYQITDPAFRFFYKIIAPWESVLATQNEALVWEQHVAPALDTHMGFVFEAMAEEAYYRLQKKLALPLVKEWGRWEGLDRQRRPLELDIASTLVDGRVLTGAVKWRRTPVDLDVHNTHLEMLTRLADAGVPWAKTAQEHRSPLLYVAASGFTDRFRRVAEESRETVYLWSLEEMYQELLTPQTDTEKTAPVN